MDKRDIDAPIADLANDGEPGPGPGPGPGTGVISDDDDDDDAIIGPNKEDVVVQMGEEFDVAKLSEEDLLELVSGSIGGSRPLR